MRSATASTLVLLGSLAWASPAPAAPPAADADAGAPPPRVEVTLEAPEALSLQRGPGEDRPHLQGTLVATVRNASDRPVELRDLREHGFVFASPSGQLSVLVHPCQCVKDAAEPTGAVFTLAPGEARRVSVDDWGCGGGSWLAPAPGRYQVEYRALPAPAAPARASKAAPAALVPRCREELASPSFWQGAARSKPVEVELKAPKSPKKPRP